MCVCVGEGLIHVCVPPQIFGSRVRVDSTAKVAEIEMAEKEKMKEKVDRILKHGINCFINRCLIHSPFRSFGLLAERYLPQNVYKMMLFIVFWMSMWCGMRHV